MNPVKQLRTPSNKYIIKNLHFVPITSVVRPCQMTYYRSIQEVDDEDDDDDITV